MAMVLLAGGLVGPIVAGLLNDFSQTSGGPRRTILVASGLCLLSTPAALFSIMPSLDWSVVLLTLFVVTGAVINVMFITLSTIVVPAAVRGTCIGCMFTVSLIANGIAPLVVSVISTTSSSQLTLSDALAAVGALVSAAGAVAFAIWARRYPQWREVRS
jgi:hypothetical protein